MKLPFVTLGILALYGSPLPAQVTTAEQTGYRETSAYSEVFGFLDSLERRTGDLLRWRLGTTAEGRELPVVLASRPMVHGPAAAHRSGKPLVYLQANIHGGEVEGKEAVQMLLRDLTTGALRPLLDSIILLVVPIYNADGNERLAPADRNRPGQNGPPEVGERSNGQGLDLNRDYVKQEAPETRAALALLDRWNPDFFIDLHTTNGSYHGYLLTYSPGLNPNSAPANEYVRDRFLPAIRERMRRRHGQETFWYGNFRNQTPDSLVQGWETYDGRARYGTNLAGLQGRISILSEAYSNAPFQDRVSVTYNFVREILSLAAEERSQVKSVVAATSRYRPDSVVLRSALAPATEQDVIAELTEPAGDGAGPFAQRRRTGEYRTIRMPVYDRFVGVRRTARPAGYLVPPQHGHLVTLLHRQGVLVQRFRVQWSGAAETFMVDSVSVARGVFEGHRTIAVEGRWGRVEAVAAPGWFYVSTDQPLGVLAAYLLEPESEDGFATWNLLDRDLRPRARFPVIRVIHPILGGLVVVGPEEN